MITLAVASAATERLADGTLSYLITFEIRAEPAAVAVTVSTLRFMFSAAGAASITTIDVPASEVLSSTRIAGGATAQSVVRLRSGSNVQATDVGVRVVYEIGDGETGESEGNWDVSPAADWTNPTGASGRQDS